MVDILFSDIAFWERSDMENFKPFPHFGTDATHAGQDPDQWKSRAVVPLISMSTTFKQSAPGEHSVSHK